METAYRTHRGLLFSALGRLAREGYVAPPAESIDLIHDFFVEAWEGLASRYDPTRAKIPTYLYAAFVRFARPRIARVQRMRATLVDPHELAEALAEDEGSADLGRAVDLARMRDALAALPPASRMALDTWLNVDRTSERDVARSLGLTRYRSRQLLIEVLGRVMTELGPLSNWPEPDRRVAHAMWQEQLGFKETAARYGLAAQAVKNAYRRNQARMQAALSLVQCADAQNSGSTAMPTKTGLGDLIDRVRRRPTDQTVLDELSSRAAELVQHFAEHGDADALEQWSHLEAHVLADIYEALSSGLGEVEHTITDDGALFQADAADRCRVGVAFQDALVPALPTGIDGLVSRYDNRHHAVPWKDFQALLREPDVGAGGEDARRMAAFGLTPVHIVLASDAVALLLQRASMAGYFDRAAPIDVMRNADGRVLRVVDARRQAIEREVLVSEIGEMTTLEGAKGAPLLDWMVEAAPRVSELFAGYNAVDDNGPVRLTSHQPGTEQRNLLHRWRSALLLREEPGQFLPSRSGAYVDGYASG